MKILLCLGLIAIVFFNCRKELKKEASCDIEQTYMTNEQKVTIANGIWGTIAFTEGNCMPIINPVAPDPCKTCPVKRKVKVFEYTKVDQATPQNFNRFYTSFNTRLITEVDTDNDGFFQIDVPQGQYTVVVVEDNQLYAFGYDGQNGISPMVFTGGKQRVNLTLTYKAVF